MRISTVALATALTASLLVYSVYAEPGVDVGKIEYESNCASCHGLAGKGDGPLANVYVPRPSDLTTLMARNGGVFPAQRVYEVIDGQQEVEAHGPRVMPVWGQDYRAKAADVFYPHQGGGPYIHDLRGGIARAKILSLVDYLHRLQEN